MSDTATTNNTNEDQVRLSKRISDNPGPATRWIIGAFVLVLIEFGALVKAVMEIVRFFAGFIPGDPGVAMLSGAIRAAQGIPTLLSRDLIPNQGYYNGEEWVGTFLGLEPKYAWLIRVVLIYVYVLLWLGWIWVGYRWFREHYRYADWTPRDDMIDRLRGHRWGQFGFIVVVLFVVLAVFAPAIGPTIAEKNINRPYSYETTFYDESTDSVRSVPVGVANLQSTSKGDSSNVGVWQYDDFDRFHPFGTLPSGKDLFTFLAYGARISLLIGVVSVTISGTIAIVFSMISAYYKGLADLALVFTSDSIQALPLLLILILAVVVFQGSWIAKLYDGAVLLIAIYSFFYWPFFWRAIRGPALQISEETWIDAAKSYGQRPSKIMEKHMIPYVLSYLLIYGSLTVGGIIISTAALSFLGLGIKAPTPEWGRAVSVGQSYVNSQSWHISLIPGVLITLLVVGFNALGDGIRDAIDPQSGGSETEEAAITGGGGG